jgi:hypothetical protein
MLILTTIGERPSPCTDLVSATYIWFYTLQFTHMYKLFCFFLFIVGNLILIVNDQRKLVLQKLILIFTNRYLSKVRSVLGGGNSKLMKWRFTPYSNGDKWVLWIFWYCLLKNHCIKANFPKIIILSEMVFQMDHNLFQGDIKHNSKKGKVVWYQSYFRNCSHFRATLG